MSDTTNDWQAAYEVDDLDGSDFETAALLSSWTAMASLLAAALGPFTCYTTYLLSLPLAGVAIYNAWQVVNAPPGTEDIRQLRNVSYASLVGGILSGMMSGFFLAIILMVLLMYAGMFFFVFVAALAGA